MLIGVQGTIAFKNYQTFLRSMGVAMSGLKEEDHEILVYTAGPATVNSFVAEFCNLSERGLKARGKKIRFFKVPPAWINDNMHKMDYFAFFCLPKENESFLVKKARDLDVEGGVFRY